MSKDDSTSLFTSENKALLVAGFIFMLPVLLFLGEIWVPLRIYYSNNVELCYLVEDSEVIQKAMSVGPGTSAPSFSKATYNGGNEYIGTHHFLIGDTLCLKTFENKFNNTPLVMKKGASIISAIYYYNNNPAITFWGLLVYLIFILILLISSLVIIFRLYTPTFFYLKEIPYSKNVVGYLTNAIFATKDLILKTIIIAIISLILFVLYKGFLIVENLPSGFIGVYFFLILLVVSLPQPYSLDSLIHMLVHDKNNKVVTAIKDLVYIIIGSLLIRKILLFYSNMDNNNYQTVKELVLDLFCFILGC